MLISMTPADRALIKSAAKAAGVTEDDLAWAESVLRGETDA
jgi:hypothetical protein